ncbi:MAG: type VI secretion system-associated protein TagF [Deltaproteobacteria bacterium]|nr:type VI secretion system-associated protein TagF [Deltaproteobacteria bacterium]
MLGLGRSANAWQWHVSGKHPVAKDYFSSGPKSPVAEAFAEWMRRGTEKFAASREILSRACSWRFWAKTATRETIVCGVVRNSCDSVGRPYPFLVMGTGLLEKWEEHWDLLPYACEGLWNQMEQMATRNYSSFERLKEDLLILRPPLPQWPELDAKRSDLLAGQDFSGLNQAPAAVDRGQDIFFMPLQCASHDPFALIIQNHITLKQKIGMVPNSLFIGGLIDQPGFALFTRPLTVSDFERMWEPAE